MSKRDDRWPAVMTRDEAARYCGMSGAMFDEHVRASKIACVRHSLGTRTKYRKQDLDFYIDHMEVVDGTR